MTNYYVSAKELEQMNEKNNILSNSNVYPNSSNLTSTLNNSSENFTFQNNTIPYVSENVNTTNTLINPNPIADSINNTITDHKNKESPYYLDQMKDVNNMSNSINSNLSYNEYLNKSQNYYIDSLAQNHIDVPKTDKSLHLSGSDFLNKNASYNGINFNKSLENPSQITFEQASSRAYEAPTGSMNNNTISDLNVVSAASTNQDTNADKYKDEIDQLIKETLEKSGLPYQPTVKNTGSQPEIVNKYYSSAGQLYDSNRDNPYSIPKPAYQGFLNSYHGAAKYTPDDSIKVENKAVIIPEKDFTDRREIIFNDSAYPNYVKNVATNDMNSNNDLYNEQLTFKDNLSNNGSVNIFNSNYTKENNYNTSLTNPNYTFENLKSEENIEKKDLVASSAAAPSAPKTEVILLENLNKSSNEQFKASEAILKASDDATKKPESGINNKNFNSHAISNLKKNEDLTFASNKNLNSARESAKEKNKNKEIPEIKEDYINTQSSISNFQKEYLSEEDFKNLQFELGKTYPKDLSGEQINIISRYLEIGKVLTSMLPGILNNVNPVNRMDAFKILVSNVHDWPNEESYFNGIICFLPTANQKEATDIVKRMNRSNCCCSVF